MWMARHKYVKSKVKPEDCWKHYVEDVPGNNSSIYKTVRLMETDPMLKFLENSSWRIGFPKILELHASFCLFPMAIVHFLLNQRGLRVTDDFIISKCQIKKIFFSVLIEGRRQVCSRCHFTDVQMNFASASELFTF